MKIVHIVPGSGGTFYCQNCMRDNELVKSLMAHGHEIFMVPMYLPVNIDDHGNESDIPIFYGAINMYLKEKFPLYRHAPKMAEETPRFSADVTVCGKKIGFYTSFWSGGDDTLDAQG